MHELSLAYSVVELVARELSCHGGGSLRSIEMSVGNLSGIDPEAFLFALKSVWAHSPFADALIKINRVEARAACNRCGKEFCPESLYASSPCCGDFPSRLIAGNEFRLNALTVECKE